MTLDRSRHGWEGISNGGEIYGNQNHFQPSDLEQDYLNTVKRFALNKMKNNITFEGLLESAIRRMSSFRLEISKKSLMKDIEKEILEQATNFGNDSIVETRSESIDDIESQIDG